MKDTFQINLLKLLSALLLISAFLTCRRPDGQFGKIEPAFPGVDTAQVDSLVGVLSLEEKLGQLLLWQPENLDSAGQTGVLQQVEKGRVSGLILSGLSLTDFARLSDSCRKIAQVPLLMGTAEKVSLFNQFSGFHRFPMPVSMASIDSSGLHRILETHYWKQCKALGINFSFNPTLKWDDQEKPVFDFQTFENHPESQAERTHWSLQSLRRHRILAAADNFSELLFIENDTIRDSLLSPYLRLTKAGLTGIMVNSRVFTKDTLTRLPAGYVNQYLEKYLDFNGLTIAKLEPQESPGMKIFEGVDLLVTSDQQKTLYSLLKLMERGRFSDEELNRRVRKVLIAKAWIHGGRLPLRIHSNGALTPARLVSSQERNPAIFNTTPPSLLTPDIESLECYFIDPAWDYFIRTLYERSVILVRNHEDVLPIGDLANVNLRLLEYASQPLTNFRNYFSKYADYEGVTLTPSVAGDLVSPDDLDRKTGDIDVVLLDGIDLQPGFHKDFITNLNERSHRCKIILINFGNPKNLQYFEPTLACVQIFERNSFTEAYAAQLVFGGAMASGRLPLAISDKLPFGASVRNKTTRLGYAVPEKAGIAHERLVSIDAIAESAIDHDVFPGCQVAVAKDGQIIYSKAFGYHTYARKTPVATSDLFDIASVTKIAATTLATMRLAEEGKLDLQGKIHDYIAIRGQYPVGNITVEHLLLHQSGLQAQMPIAKFYSWRNVPSRGCNSFFCKKRRGKYNIEVANGLFFRQDLRDTIWKRVLQLPVASKRRFHYSDVNFFLLQKAIENLSGERLDSYVVTNFYQPLGLRRINFKPLRFYSKKEIVPTEHDRAWRKTLVHGTVHDPAVALMGGVGGSAGVFSTAEDLAVLFEMLLRKGNYGGVQFFKPETVEMFTATGKLNHRSLGFDKPANRRYPTYSRLASSGTYGHTGFTGTCVWVDPKQNLVYVFLSNRVHPSARNGKIFTEAIRSRIHQVVYDAFASFQNELPELVLPSEMIEED
jgi:CubicO group peptidase (beta-lactamase class C family)